MTTSSHTFNSCLHAPMILRIRQLLPRRFFSNSALPHVICMRRGDGERDHFDPAAPTVLFLHGILGSGKNWSSFAKRVAKQCALQAVLIDLRCHGA
jgi:pimeloyl-ACP methyl ester carboxylesterase